MSYKWTFPYKIVQLQIECFSQSHASLAQPSNVSGFSFFRRVSQRRELAAAHKSLSNYRAAVGPCRSSPAIAVRRWRFLIRDELSLCLPRGCKSELDDPPSFSHRPVIRLRPRPSFSPSCRARPNVVLRASDLKFMLCDNSRRDTPRAYVLHVAKAPT